MYILSYPDDQPLVLDLLIRTYLAHNTLLGKSISMTTNVYTEYPDPSHAAKVHSSPAVSAAFSALRPHLAIDPHPSPEEKRITPLRLHGSRLLEILEFRFLYFPRFDASTADLDRRAVELLFSEFAGVTTGDTCCLGEPPQPVHLEYQGDYWSQGDDDGEGGYESYKRLFWWRGAKEEEQ